MSTKIKKIEAFLVASPDSPLGNRDGIHYPWFFRGIVRATADNGKVGIAEIPGIPDAVAMLNSEDTQVLLRDRPVVHFGRIIEDFEAAHPQIRTQRRGGKTTWDPRAPIHAFAGFDVALHDLFARCDGSPLYEVIGHPYRDFTRFNAYGFFNVDPARTGLEYIADDGDSNWARRKMMEAMTVAAVADQFDDMIEYYGYEDAKLKGGFADPDHEADCIIEIKRRHSNLRVTLDPNACWDMETALRIGERLKPYVDYLEDPVAGTGPMGEFQRRSGIKTATNMAVTALEEFAAGIKDGAITIMLADPMFFGGLRQSKVVTRMCEAVGWEVACHSNNHLLAELLQMATLGTQVKNPGAYDTHWSWTRRKYDVVYAPDIEIRDGVLQLPKRPGLGVDLDEQMLLEGCRRAETLQAAGYHGRNDVIVMENIFGAWVPATNKWALQGLRY